MMWGKLLCLFILLRCSTAVRSYQLLSCPHDDPELVEWSPVDDDDEYVVIDGEKLVLMNSVSLGSITVTNGGKLVISDDTDIILRVSHLLLEYEGEFHVGGESCRHQSQFELILWGRTDDSSANLNAFGRKVLAAAPNTTLEMHGQPKLSWTRLTETLVAGEDTEYIITLEDDVTSWNTGDVIVIASTDFDMEHAEEFSLLDCPECASNQVKIPGPVEHQHYSANYQGVEMRAEVGMLTRNIKVHGEMEDACYDDNLCDYYDYDTHGGQTQILSGYRNAHFFGVEMYHMGQQVLGSYPIHFHRTWEADDWTEYPNPAYVMEMSIHHCFSRCVTIHSTDALLVQDVVGYDTLGHCFFLEDGNEQRNVFIHNLGLVTRNGALLPSDRDDHMCTTLLDGTWEDYVPNPPRECRGASTFWIVHPNTDMINNAAAGSADVGIFFVFHREPTSLSPGLLPPYHSELSPMGSIINNTAHSNIRTGFAVDRGVKVDPASEEDPREHLALTRDAQYMPHEDTDPTAPRVPAIIEGLTAYKNNDIAVHVRGGDIFFRRYRAADNLVAMSMVSALEGMPYDAGSHQETSDSIIVGYSDNAEPGQVAICGAVIRMGPLFYDNIQFYNYPENTGALCFPFDDGSQMSAKSRIGSLTFTDIEAPLVEMMGTMDGSLTQMFLDLDGSFTLEPNTYVVRGDNMLMSCEEEFTPGHITCSADDIHYGQLFMETEVYDSSMNMTMVRDDFEDYPLTFQGANPDSDNVKWFQPTVIAGESYSVHWSHQAPEHMTITGANFLTGRFVILSLCYPADTEFEVTYDEWDQMSDTASHERVLEEGNNLNDVIQDINGWTYYWDQNPGVLQIKIVERFLPQEPYNYCSSFGCQRIHISATMVNSDISNCM